MTNHLHLIVGSDENNDLSETISAFKRFTTQQLYELLKKDHREYILNILRNSYSKTKEQQIWQNTNYPELICTDKFLDNKMNYIHYNPVRKGYVLQPEHWKYSSARNRISDDSSLICVENY
jgi:putative transposase